MAYKPVIGRPRNFGLFLRRGEARRGIAIRIRRMTKRVVAKAIVRLPEGPPMASYVKMAV